ncbi:MAG: alcohol dehydrogenase catalytic domain-containing protein [Deltaproteobacteria bacterium]|nr:alcohol dehydrogenase catalytic domain-containing protein [Deltaproteobacteria bacterium]
MRALVFDSGIRLADVDEPRRGANDALLRVRLAGICNTDLEITRGYMDFRGTLGHELVADVLEADDDAWVGARVCAEINFACGECPSCEAGLGRHCPTRRVMGILGAPGCFAERVVVPQANLHRVPDHVRDEAAVFAEPLAAAFEVVEQVEPSIGERALVVGDGKLGLLCAMVLKSEGLATTLVGRHARKRAIAEASGVHAFAPELLQEGDFDLVVEATGQASGLSWSMERVRPRGTLALKSTFHGDLKLDTAKLVIDEITLLGSRCGSFERALAALSAGTVDPTPLIDAVHPLSDGVEAMARASAHGSLKHLLDARLEVGA